jgi:glycosyltransferase involved in cell wall biosynthesis
MREEMERPTVDVLVTVYNGAAHLRLALQSLTSQTFTDFLIHVVDDGSTDSTPAILSEMAAADRRMRLYRKENGGVVEATNYGLQFCQAEYLARLDADDISYPDRLERQVEILRSNPSILAVSGDAHKIDMDGKRLPEDALSSSPDKADLELIPAREPYLMHPFLMIRREALERAGGYRSLVVAEDSDLYWRLQEIGRLYNDKHFYGEYRMNPASLSSRSVAFGRIMAVSSQLAAISAMRRRAGSPDLDFTPDYAEALKGSSASLQAVCAAAAQQLIPSEVEHLRAAAGAKLVEMASYRPYELELSDCAFIGKTYTFFRRGDLQTGADYVVKSFNGAAARLAASGKWDEARALLDGDLGPSFWSRYLFRLILPPATRRRIRAVLGRK